MQLQYKRTDIPNPIQVLRQSGYSQFIDPNTKLESFIIRLSKDFYPRFHLYLEENNDIISFNLHLDQKKPSYKGTNMHGGEYEGPTVEKEMDRIRRWAQALYPKAEEIRKGMKEIVEEIKPVDTTKNTAPDADTIQTAVKTNEKNDDMTGDLFRGIFS